MLTSSLDSELAAAMCHLGDVDVVLRMHEVDPITVVCASGGSERKMMEKSEAGDSLSYDMAVVVVFPGKRYSLYQSLLPYSPASSSSKSGRKSGTSVSTIWK
jgi:hypothetical protein